MLALCLTTLAFCLTALTHLGLTALAFCLTTLAHLGLTTLTLCLAALSVHSTGFTVCHF